MKLLVILLLLSCGTEENKEDKRTEVIVERAEPVEVVVTGEVGEKGDTGVDGSDGTDGEDAEGCYTQNELSRTKWHHDHDDYYYDVLMICPDNVNYIARDVKYHEEL